MAAFHKPRVSTIFWVELTTVVVGIVFAGGAAVLIATGLVQAEVKQSVLWAALFGVVWLIVCLVLYAIHAATREAPTKDVDIVRGALELVHKFEAMREEAVAEDKKPHQIRAVWCTEYHDVNIQNYFQMEFDLLHTHREANIERLINPDRVGENAFKLYKDAYAEFCKKDPAA